MRYLKIDKLSNDDKFTMSLKKNINQLYHSNNIAREKAKNNLLNLYFMDFSFSFFQLINDMPKKGADNKRIVFLPPKSTNGVLVELCEEIS